jgi:hypothetical protein
MRKTLSERVAMRAAKKKPSKRAVNRGAFLALRSEVKQALDDGWPVKTIWETLQDEGLITFSYQSFRGYANRLILSQAKPAYASGLAGQKSAVRCSESETCPTTGERRSTRQAGVGGFRFESEPKKEDLL